MDKNKKEQCLVRTIMLDLILEPIFLQEKEPQRFVTLKWAMVSTMTGAGMIVAYIVGKLYHLGNRDMESL